MYQNLIILVLLFIIMVISFILYNLAKKQKIIPWSRQPVNRIKMFLRQKPHIISSWNDMNDYLLFPRDGKMVMISENPPKPNSIIRVGSKGSHDIFIISSQIRRVAGMYTFDVDFMGPGSDSKGFQITYTT